MNFFRKTESSPARNKTAVLDVRARSVRSSIECEKLVAGAAGERIMGFNMRNLAKISVTYMAKYNHESYAACAPIMDNVRSAY
jgi:hypothetical protein